MTAPTVHGDHPRAGRRGVAGPIAAAVGIGGALAALHLRDPHVRGSWGMCPLYALTGVYCPGCGGLRAVNDLTNLHFGDAFFSNPLVYPIAIMLVWLWVYWLGSRLGVRVPAVPQNTWLWATVGVLILAWTVARNLPGFPLVP